jgi:Sulfotransferase domain
MSTLERAVKALVPAQAKGVAKEAIRGYGQLTAHWRPLPEFLVLGTKRGGSTSAWRYLEQHPQVLPMMPGWEHLKSPHYFYWHYARGEAWYRSHFPSAATRRAAEQRLGKRVVTGESSPYYLFNPYVPARVARDLPQARFIVLLRDPVKRAYSHYWERVDNGVEPLGFAAALAAEPDRLAGETERMAADPYYYSRPHDWYTYRERGCYATQLQRWFDAVGRDRVLVIVSEDMYGDPQPVMDEMAAFLGIDPAPIESFDRHNHRPAEPMAAAVAAELREYYQPHNAALAALLGRELPWG